MCTDVQNLAKELFERHVGERILRNNPSRAVLIIANIAAMNEYDPGYNMRVDVSHLRNRYIAANPGIIEALTEECKLHKLNQII